MKKYNKKLQKGLTEVTPPRNLYWEQTPSTPSLAYTTD